jgi:hypothetical protein
MGKAWNEFLEKRFWVSGRDYALFLQTTKTTVPSFLPRNLPIPCIVNIWVTTNALCTNVRNLKALRPGVQLSEEKTRQNVLLTDL